LPPGSFPHLCRVATNGRLCKAIADYRWLLDRGYPQQAALNIVTERYMLGQKERMLLYRCVHTSKCVQDVALRHLREVDLANFELIVDGYNVLLTIIAALKNEGVYICDDGFVRDLRGAKLRHGEREYLLTAIEIMGKYLARIPVRYVTFVFDSTVSHSAKHAKITAEILGKLIGKKIHYELAKKVDTTLISHSKNNDVVVASSDIVVLLKAAKIYDLAGRIIASFMPSRISMNILCCLA